MSKPAGKDEKKSKRAYLQALVNSGGGMSVWAANELASAPELPDTMRYLWEWFCELSAARGASMNGLNPISYPDIDAWSRLRGVEPDASEVHILTNMDAAFRRVLAAD